jgi:D-3-phosphoglycerate dehydrogenase
VDVSAAPRPTREELAETEILVIRSRTKIDKELLANAPKLKMVVTATSGFDHIDLVETSARDLKVMFTPNANAASAAELTWALVLACARRVTEAHRAVKAGDWKRESLIGRELSGKTYGVIGLGRIGSRVARIALAFGMKVIAFDPYKDDEDFERVGATRVSLEELLRLADVVSVHVPATSETERMLNAVLLESMNRSAIFVNTSRGSVVTERDLIQALSEHWIAACGLDVFEREPLARDSRLLSFPNVVVSPHLGATTTEAFSQASQDAAEKVRAFAASGSVSDPLPPREPWFVAGFGRRTPSARD